MTFVFSFDASACSGCKACQAACKDKNNLPAGVLWRRVIEVSGGEWIQKDDAWNNSVFAYNLSMACNHCVHPKCAGVCPTNAYHVREDGIVLLDSSRCVGCGYCNWACPYAVPQYNPASGTMSKCNFCFDDLDAGQSPACVAACPLRVLDFLQVEEQKIESPGVSLWDVPGSEHPFPLPQFSRTQPHLHLFPHPAMLNELVKAVTNREEIKPGVVKSELPLVFFTLLAQMSVGLLWSSLCFFTPPFVLLKSPRLITFVLAGLCLSLGMLVSFAHLGRKSNAWRMLGNLQKSWLSREILALGLFAVGGLLFFLSPGIFTGGFAAFLGVVLLYSMANVYRLRSMAVWNTWRTLAGFALSALLLGLNAQILVLEAWSIFTGLRLDFRWLSFLVVLFLGLDLWLVLISRAGLFGGANPWRSILIFLAGSGLLGLQFMPGLASLGLALFVLLLVMLEEGLDRYFFYAQLELRVL